MGSRWRLWPYLIASATLAVVGCKDLRFPVAPSAEEEPDETGATRVVFFVANDSLGQVLEGTSFTVDSGAYDAPGEDNFRHSYSTRSEGVAEAEIPLGRRMDLRVVTGCCDSRSRGRVFRDFDFADAPDTIEISLDAPNLDIQLVLPPEILPLDSDSDANLHWVIPGDGTSEDYRADILFGVSAEGRIRAEVWPGSLELDINLRSEGGAQVRLDLEDVEVDVDPENRPVEVIDIDFDYVDLRIESPHPEIPRFAGRMKLGEDPVYVYRQYVEFDFELDRVFELRVPVLSSTTWLEASTFTDSRVLGRFQSVNLASADTVVVRLGEIALDFRVVDATGRPVIATIWMPPFGGGTLRTDTAGRCRCFVPAGSYFPRVVEPGFQSWSSVITVDSDLAIEVVLEEAEP